MYTKNFGVDLNGGHLVEGLDKLLLPRQELLFGSVQSQKSQQLLELHRKYKRRLMHPLQVNKQLRVMKELDFLVPERDFLTWVQFSGLEANPEVEKLMEHVKNISSVSQQVFRGRSVEDTKVPPKPLRKEDFLKKNLPKNVYKKVKIAKKKDQDPEEADQEQEKMSRDTLGPEEEDTTTLEDQDEKEMIEAEDEETLMKQLSEIQHNKKNLKQLNNNVYFRYTKRKLLLLRSLGSLPSREEIVKTFFQKTENNYHEKDKELRDKLKQELSNDARLILTHKKNLYEFHQKLRGRGNITIEDMIKRCSSVNLDNQEKERVTGPTAATENFDTARGVRTSYRRGEYSSNPGKAQPETKQVFPSTLQHLDEVPSSGAIDSENVEKETKPSIVNIKSSRRLVKDHRGTTSLATFDSATIKSQALMSTRCQTRQDMSFEERRRKLQSESKVFERLSAENSARKGGSKAQRSPDPIPRGKPVVVTKTNGPNLQTEQKLKTPLRCVSKGKIMEIANRTPERPMTTLKSIMRRPPQTSRLETEPENTSSYRDDRPPSKELDTMRMQQTERCLERAWNKEPAPRNTIGHGPERRTVKGDTEAILSSVLEHGRKKREKVPLPEDKRKEQEELTTRIGKQLQEFFSYRKDVSKLTDPLEYTSVMVKICPEIQTIYNLRKEIIQQRLETMNSKEKHAFLIKELMSLLPLMKQNPKSYCLWHHRKWCFIKGLEVEKEDPTIEKILAKQEFGLCEMQLAKDERNFHVWNYRSWIVNTLKALDQNVIDKELKFIDSKLEANFSNFSALHFKSKNLLAKYTLFLQDLNEKKVSELEDPKLVKDVLLYGLPLDTIKAELETVKTGLYMQSAEQSMWLYHQWLIDRIIPIRVKYVKFFGKTDKGVTLGLLFSQKIMNLNHHTLRISRASEDKNLEFEIQPVGTGKFTNAFRITVLADGPVDKLVIRLLNPDKVLEAQGESELGDAIEYCIVSSEGKRLVADSPCQVELAGEHKCTYYSQETSDREKELSNLVEEQRKVVLEILELEPDSRFAHSQLIYVIHNKEEPYSNTKEGLQKRLELNKEVVKSSENLLQKNPEKANRFAYFLKLYKLKSRILESLKEGDLAKAREIEQTEEAKSINLGEIADLLLLSDVKIANNEVSNLITLFNQSASNE